MCCFEDGCGGVRVGVGVVRFWMVVGFVRGLEMMWR